MKNKLSLLLIAILTFTGCTTNNSSSSNNDTKLLESFLHGKGVPSSDIGYDFSYYYDEETRFVYEKNRGEWINTYTIGGESLYENISQMSKEVSSRKLKNGHHKGHKEKQELINSIARSFYSTDITMRFNTELDFSLMDFKRNKNFAEVPGGTDENGNIINDYLRYNPAGHEILNDGKWEKIIDFNPNLFCLAPFPSVDNIFYTNWGIYQEDLGQMTAIVAANIDQAYYDETDGYYKIDEIHIEHDELESYYMTYPDKLSFQYWFKLSEDREYVTNVYFKVLTSTFQSIVEICDFHIEFFDYHNTIITIPEYN